VVLKPRGGILIEHHLLNQIPSQKERRSEGRTQASEGEKKYQSKQFEKKETEHEFVHW